MYQKRELNYISVFTSIYILYFEKSVSYWRILSLSRTLDVKLNKAEICWQTPHEFELTSSKKKRPKQFLTAIQSK